MKSTFHETQLGQAVIQNVTDEGPEQLIVTLEPETQSSVRVQIKEHVAGEHPASSAMSIDQRGLQRLFSWLREQGVVT
jgi:hypothetical protein